MYKFCCCFYEKEIKNLLYFKYNLNLNNEKVIGLSKSTLNSIPKFLDRISEQLEKIDKNIQMENDIAVLWDVENVNPGNDVTFIEGFLEYLSQFGRFTIGHAFADWTRKNVSPISIILGEHHFELIHVPAAKKNSADMSLITYGIELALQYPSIGIFVLVTGDSDFRPLVKSLRRIGKRILIVCDVNTARPDFLILADDFIDYRTLRPGGTTPTESQDVKDEESKEQPIEELNDKQDLVIEVKTQKQIAEQRNNAFNLLVEAISQMKMEGLKPGIGLVKVRLLMLNPDFSEKDLAFSNWSDFINSAQESGVIQVSGVGAGLLLDVIQSSKEKTDQEKAFEILLEVLKKYDDDKPKYHNQAFIAEELYKNSRFMKLKKKLGFKKFKDFIQAAEVRKLVKTKVDGLTHEIKREKN